MRNRRECPVFSTRRDRCQSDIEAFITLQFREGRDEIIDPGERGYWQTDAAARPQGCAADRCTLSCQKLHQNLTAGLEPGIIDAQSNTTILGLWDGEQHRWGTEVLVLPDHRDVDAVRL